MKINSKKTKAAEAQDELSGPNADAIRQARQRVAERKKQEEKAADEYRRSERYRDGSTWDLDDFFWADLVWGRFGIGLALTFVWMVISALLVLVESLRTPFYWALRFLDVATGGHVMPHVPWLMWMFWGGIFGASLGYWLIAPLYGNRENRWLVLCLPLLVMVVSGVLMWGFVR